MAPDGMDVTRLTWLSSGIVETPAVSDDLSLVAFVHDGDPLGTNPTRNREVFLMSGQGTGLRQLTRGGGDLANHQDSDSPQLSADGSVVVGQSHSARGYEAFRWEAGVMIALGDLPGGGTSGLAAGASADGRSIVGQGWSEAGLEAFAWRGGALGGLGDLPGGGFSSEAFGLSADGRVAVGRSHAAAGSEAVLWTDLRP